MKHINSMIQASKIEGKRLLFWLLAFLLVSLTIGYRQIGLNVLAEETTPPEVGVISGRLWVDGNGKKSTDWNGLFDDGEKPLSDYPVFLYQAVDKTTAIAQTKTFKDGSYRFENLAIGEYYVGLKSDKIDGTEYLLPMAKTKDCAFAVNENFTQSFTEVITINGNEAIENVNAGLRLPMGFVPLASVGSYETKIGDVNGPTIYHGTSLQSAFAVCTTPGTTYYIITGNSDDAMGDTVVMDAPGVEIILTTFRGLHLTITQNQADKRHIIVKNGSLIIKSVILHGLRNGGGIEVDGQTPNTSLMITDDAIIAFCKTSKNGGAIYIKNATLSIIDAYIQYNESAGDGGGIYLDEGVTANFDYVDFYYNLAGNNGAGLYVNKNSTARITNITKFEYNEAKLNGGGIYTQDDTNYSNIQVDASVEFNNNEAQAGIYWVKNRENITTVDLANYYNSVYVSAPLGHPLNNWDINAGTHKGSVVIGGKKEVVGNPAVNIDFNFRLIQVKMVNGKVQTYGNGAIELFTSRKGSGFFSFEAIENLTPDIYYFIMEEVDDGETYWTYDPHKYLVTVTVVDTPSLSAEIAFSPLS